MTEAERKLIDAAILAHSTGFNVDDLIRAVDTAAEILVAERAARQPIGYVVRTNPDNTHPYFTTNHTAARLVRDAQGGELIALYRGEPQT